MVTVASVLLFAIIGLLSTFIAVRAEKEPVENAGVAGVDSPILDGALNNRSDYDYGDFKRPAPILDKFTPSEDPGFIHAFLAALSVIVVSELGDKTFFIAAIMAMRHPRVTVFVGAILALTVMTVLSACLGFATTIVPRIYTFYISTALFAIFGLKMLREGYYMSPNAEAEELEQVQADLRKREEELNKAAQEPLATSDVEAAVTRGGRRKLLACVSQVFLQAFTMTFLAEWGDRSQLTTIILAARENAYGVTIGGVLGHAFCTSVAVIGGRIVAQRISVRTVTIVGGFVFLLFALSAVVTNFV